MNLKKIAHYAVLIVIACIFLVPLLYVFYNSLLPYRYVQTWAPIDVWTLDNYKELFQKYPILQWYWNTFVSTVIVVVGNLVFPVMAGYALAKLRFPGRKLIFSILLISMMVPFQLMMIQMYIMLAKMNMHNTIFYSVPDELIEAARIDGVSHAGAFFKIVCPMSKPLYATIAILAFTGTWNSYLVPATFINRIEKYTLVVGLQTVNMSFFQKTNLTMAGVVLLSFPVILFFIFNQKKFVQGVMSSGIKA